MEDRMIPPDAQRAMSKRAVSKVVEVEGSRAVYVSQPDAVPSLIEQAAAGAWKRSSRLSKEYLEMTTTMPEPCPIDFARPLGGLEHLFSLIDRHRTVHFAMAAQIEGLTSIPAWRAALDKLQERHPLLSVAIEINDGSVPHFRAVRNAPIPLRVTVGPTVSSWHTEIARELANPFDSQQSSAGSRRANARTVRIGVHPYDSPFDRGRSLIGLCNTRLDPASGRGELRVLAAHPALEPLVYKSQHAPNDTDDSGQPEEPQEGRAATFRTVNSSLPHIEALQCGAVSC